MGMDREKPKHGRTRRHAEEPPSPSANDAQHALTLEDLLAEHAAAAPNTSPMPSKNPRANPGLVVSEALVLNASAEASSSGPRLTPRAVPAPSHARLPPVSEVRCVNTTRLLPSKYSESVLTRIAESDEDLQLIFALDSATNDRLLAEGNLRLGITARELVFDVPSCRIINAAYTHPHPQGARFSTPYRGAWYAGLELATAKAEVLFHRTVQFAEINWQQPEELEYDQYTADFNGCFHDLRPGAFSGEEHACYSQSPDFEPHPGVGPLLVAQHADAQTWERAPTIQAAEAPPSAAEFAECLALNSYIASQQLSIQLLEAGSLGILYPSARRPGGNCIACFRPSLVSNVRKRDLYRLRWFPDRPATFVRSPRVLPAMGLPRVTERGAG